MGRAEKSNSREFQSGMNLCSRIILSSSLDRFIALAMQRLAVAGDVPPEVLTGRGIGDFGAGGIIRPFHHDVAAD
jgi:hypothetical protein